MPKNAALQKSILINDSMPLVLCALSCVPELAENLVLKGGAAMKQFLFPRFRLSNDLDFSALAALPQAQQLTEAMQEAGRCAQCLLPGGTTMVAVSEFDRGMKPVPMRSFNFQVWRQGAEPVNIVLELSLDEAIIETPIRRPLVALSNMRADTLVYTLDEMIAEKMRALLQWARQCDRGRDDMPVARAYFDLHWLLKRHLRKMDSARFQRLLFEKCAVRDVRYEGVQSFFAPKLLQVNATRWRSQLSQCLRRVPDPDTVLCELVALMPELCC